MGFDRTLLVTGAGGQLGRAFVTILPHAFGLTRTDLDVTDRNAVQRTIQEYKPEIIVNCAAFTQVDRAEEEAEAATTLNSTAVRHLASAAQVAGSLLVQPSTDYVFSGDKHGAYREDDSPDPKSVYGKTKLAGEQAARSIQNHLVVRTSWVFGNGVNFIRSILEAARLKDELEVVDDQRGLPTYALDLAKGILGLLEKEALGIYHIAGSGESATWADVAEFALETAGSPAKVRRVTTADYYSQKQGPLANRPRNSVLDCSKAENHGVRLRPWREAVVAYIRGIS